MILAHGIQHHSCIPLLCYPSEYQDGHSLAFQILTGIHVNNFCVNSWHIIWCYLKIWSLWWFFSPFVKRTRGSRNPAGIPLFPIFYCYENCPFFSIIVYTVSSLLFIPIMAFSFKFHGSYIFQEVLNEELGQAPL